MVFFLIPVLFVLTTAIHMGVFLYLNPDGLGSNGLPKGYIGTERTRRGSAVIIGVGLWLILLPFNMFAFSALFQSMESRADTLLSWVWLSRHFHIGITFGRCIQCSRGR